MSAHVYFARSETFPDLVKIGMSRYLQERIRCLSKQYRGPLKLLGAIELPDTLEARSKERELHRKFSDFRVGGEWFRLSDEQVTPEYTAGAARCLPEERASLTLQLPLDLIKSMKILAIERGVYLQNLYIKAIEEWLSRQSDRPTPKDLNS